MLDALVTAGSCGQMSVAGLLPYLRMDGWWNMPSGARGTSICLATAAAASWPLTHSCPSTSMAWHDMARDGMARHGMSERNALVLCCWAKGHAEAWPQQGRHHQVSPWKQGDTV